MPPINILIKPASGSCQMRCEYCFYADEMCNREKGSYGMMSPEVQEMMVKKGIKAATGAITFSFQGGEPTLIGMEYFERLIRLVEKYNTKNLQVSYALQTNGYGITEEWAKFFAKHNFLVGVSLDGPRDIHDRYRRDYKGEGTFDRVMNTIRLFKLYKVEYNVLTVVTGHTADEIGRIYKFFRKNDIVYQQYIACLDPLGDLRGKMEYSLTPEKYGKFLKRLFDLWYEDMSRKHYVYNRYFENLAGMLAGYRPETCTLMGHCMASYVAEADGSMYPCDFYVLDDYRLGNLVTEEFEDFDRKRTEIGFVEASAKHEEECLKCPWGYLCRGGCRRDREPEAGAGIGKNYFCESYKEFLTYAYDRLVEIGKMWIGRDASGKD